MHDQAYPEPQLHRVTLTICDLCLDGAGGECHVPGCAMWISAAPDIPIRDKCDTEVAELLDRLDDVAEQRGIEGGPLDAFNAIYVARQFMRRGRA
jgi:hypothetical protein